MELTHSQYGKLVDAFVQAFVDVHGGPEEHRPAIRAEAELRLEDAATATAEMIREEPQESTGWNSELWDSLIVGLDEDGYAQSGIDRIVVRAAGIAEVPLP